VLTVVLFISEMLNEEPEAGLDKGVCSGLTGIEWGNTHELSIGRVKA